MYDLVIPVAVEHCFSPEERRTGAERLRILGDFLTEHVQPIEFDMTRVRVDLACGTAACAMGWAPSIPAFATLGLHLRTEWQTGPNKGFTIAYRGREGYEAARDFFFLTLDEAWAVFGEGSEYYALRDAPDELEVLTPQFVGQEIKRFADAMEAAYA